MTLLSILILLILWVRVRSALSHPRKYFKLQENHQDNFEKKVTKNDKTNRKERRTSPTSIGTWKLFSNNLQNPLKLTEN